MKKKLIECLSVLIVTVAIQAGIGPERMLELKSPHYQPERVAAKTDFRIIVITTDDRVEEHILFIAPDGKTTLLDTGSSPAWEVMLEVFAHHGITRIDQVIISHLHGDHIGGLPAILPMKELSFGKVLWQMVPDSELKDEGEQEYQNNLIRIAQVRDRAVARNIPIEEVKVGDIIDFGSGAQGKIVYGVLPEPILYRSLNNNSLIIRFEYGEFSMLLTGDMAFEEADNLFKTNANIACDVLKTAHHGGAYGTSKTLLQKTAPKVAVSSMPEWLSKDQRGIDTDTLIHAEGIPHYRSWEFQAGKQLIIGTDGKNFYITPKFE